MQNGRQRVVTQPQVEPVTLSDAKSHARIWISNDDALISGYIKAARSWCENFMRRYIVEQTVDLALDAFPCDSIDLPGGDVQAVVSVSYYDSDGTLQVWSSAKYRVDTYGMPATIEPVVGETFPATQRRSSAVIVRYRVGFTPDGSPADYTANVPEDIKQAIRLLVGHFNENRESVVVGTIVSEVPQAVESLLWPYRICT